MVTWLKVSEKVSEPIAVHRACLREIPLVFKILWYLSSPVIPLKKLIFYPPLRTFLSGESYGKGYWFFHLLMFQSRPSEFYLVLRV